MSTHATMGTRRIQASTVMTMAHVTFSTMRTPQKATMGSYAERKACVVYSSSNAASRKARVFGSIFCDGFDAARCSGGALRRSWTYANHMRRWIT